MNKAVVLEHDRIVIFEVQTDSNAVDRDLLLIENNYEQSKQQQTTLEKSSEQLNSNSNSTSTTATNNKPPTFSPTLNWEQQVNWYCSHPYVVNPEEAPPGLREHSMCIYRPNYVSTSQVSFVQQQQMFQEFGKEGLSIF